MLISARGIVKMSVPSVLVFFLNCSPCICQESPHIVLDFSDCEQPSQHVGSLQRMLHGLFQEGLMMVCNLEHSEIKPPRDFTSCSRTDHLYSSHKIIHTVMPASSFIMHRYVASGPASLPSCCSRRGTPDHHVPILGCFLSSWA